MMAVAMTRAYGQYNFPCCNQAWILLHGKNVKQSDAHTHMREKHRPNLVGYIGQHRSMSTLSSAVSVIGVM